MGSRDHDEDSRYLIKQRTYSATVDDGVVEQGNFAASTNHTLSSNGTFTHYLESDSSEEVHRRQQQQWLMNYQEAAIYLEEGNNNDKFDTHPKSQSALPAYLIAHHPFFHVIDIVASLLLLSLAIIEPPAVAKLTIPLEVHASLEIFGIAVLTLDLVFKGRWQGMRTFFKHKRSVFKSLLLLVMLVEAVIVIVRQSNHFRVTRALRPLFLLDTYYCRGIRRFCRQLLMSLPPIIELLFLLLFIMLIFSILGFYLFGKNANSVYFSTLQSSFISLFVLLTTANYPDVMMPAYNSSPLAAGFFIVYISIELFFFMNLFLAVVYSTFTEMEKAKVKKLLFHRRVACEHAFRLLVSKKHPNAVSLRHYTGLMRYYTPNTKKEDIYLAFKTLNKSKSGSLSLDEFYDIYYVQGLKWREMHANDYWFQKMPRPINRAMTSLNWLVKNKWFEIAMYVIIVGNFVVVLYEAIYSSIHRSTAVDEKHREIIPALRTSWHSILFTCIYAVEALLKMLGLGPRSYFTDGWNVFDLTVTLVSVAGLFGDLFNDSFFFFIILRPLRLVRIFKARKRYRDVLGTLFILADRLWSLAVSLLLLYYFYAVIGMELFSQYDMVNCCQNDSGIASYYANDTDSYYYLNNFDNILRSGVTLFELTVVNNWFIIMNGYAYVATEWSRIYFMTFYLITMVVMTVVVAFILEAFMFKIQYRRTTHENSSIDYLLYEQSLSLEEVHMINNVKMTSWTGDHIRTETEAPLSDLHFTGKKKRGKILLSLQMYEDEIQEWITAWKASSTSSPLRDVSPTSSLNRDDANNLASIVQVGSDGSLQDLPCLIDRSNDLDDVESLDAMINSRLEVMS